MGSLNSKQTKFMRDAITKKRAARTGVGGKYFAGSEQFTGIKVAKPENPAKTGIFSKLRKELGGARTPLSSG
jgi:hypothetical protein